MTDLDIIAQLEAKVHKLPSHLLCEADNFISELLQRYSIVHADIPLNQTVFYQVKPVSLGLKVENVDNIAAILEQYE